MSGDIIFLALLILFWVLFFTREKWNPGGSVKTDAERIIGALSVVMFWPITMFYFNICWHEAFQTYKDQEAIFLITQLIIGLAISVWIIFRISSFSWKRTFRRAIYIAIILILTSIHGPIYIPIKNWIEGLIEQRQKKPEIVETPKPEIKIIPESVKPVVLEIKKEPDTPRQQIQIVYIEKSAVREEVEVVDSLDPIVIYAEHGKWSEKAYIKKSYSDRDNPVVHFDISYSGPVRVQGHDAYGDGTTIVDLDSPDFNKKIGSDLSNWCLNFTSLTPNTEKITIRRWIKRNVRVQK